MEIVAKHFARCSFFAEERCASEGNFDRIGVGLEKIGEETTTRTIATMRLVEDENALEVGSIVVEAHLFFIFFEFVDVDDSDFGLTASALLGLIGAELLHQFVAVVGSSDDETTRFELLSSLLEEVEAVDDEIEFSHLVLASEIVGEDMR